MIDKDEQLKKRFCELSDRAALQQRITYSDFLTLHEQSVLFSTSLSTSFCLFGGFETAERKIAFFGCESLEDFSQENPIEYIQIRPVAPKFADELSHRDFLGTLMALGLRREMIGDVIVCKNNGYIVCDKKVSAFILENVDRVRHTSVKCAKVDALPIESVAMPQKQMIIIASERLDAVIASVYKLSRSAAQELFVQGKVFIDGKQTNNTSYYLSNEETVSVRGFGKFIFCGIEGTTKKSRLKAQVRIF